jgi:basic membrane protein A
VPPTSAAPSPRATVCPAHFRVGFVTDVTGLNAVVDRDGWAGVQAAARRNPCLSAQLVRSARPSDYRRNLQALAQARVDVVIAASFLLTDAVTSVARDNSGTHFVLVDPLVPPAALPNLAVLEFQVDQTGFLAGALAGMTSHTQVIAGVYGLDLGPDQAYRLGFERGARYVNPGIRVLGAYQIPSDGTPYGNPEWGATQARAFLDQGADVIFAAGGSTGQGALLAAAQAGRRCIAAENADAAAAGCLLASAVKHVDQAVELVLSRAAAGSWAGGPQSLGLAQHALGLSSLSAVPTATRQRLQTIADMLAAGSRISKN